MRKLIGIFAAATMIGTASLTAQDFDPVGDYEFEADAQGQAVTGSMTIAGSEGAWTGVIIAEALGEIPISDIEIEGNLVTIFAEIPEAGELVIEVEFDGEEFVGSWALGFDGGELVGRKIG